jgi:hypothetical protein
MVASMTHPHDPYVIPQRYWDRYEGVDIDMPRVQMPPSSWIRTPAGCATCAGSICSR